MCELDSTWCHCSTCLPVRYMVHGTFAIALYQTTHAIACSTCHVPTTHKCTTTQQHQAFVYCVHNIEAIHCLTSPQAQELYGPFRYMVCSCVGPIAYSVLTHMSCIECTALSPSKLKSSTMLLQRRLTALRMQTAQAHSVKQQGIRYVLHAHSIHDHSV